MSLLLLLYLFLLPPHIFPFPHISMYAPTRDFSFSRDLVHTTLGIILPQTKDQRAERDAERAVDRLGLRCCIISQNFNSDIGIAHRNDTSLLHAHDSHVDLSLTEATGRVDHCITLEPVRQRSYGREGETNICGNASYDQLLTPCSLNRIDDALFVPCVNRSTFDSLHAG